MAVFGNNAIVEHTYLFTKYIYRTYNPFKVQIWTTLYM